jgi:hypothetical protein
MIRNFEVKSVKPYVVRICTYSPIHTSTQPPTYSPINPPTYPPTYLSTYKLTQLHTHLPTYGHLLDVGSFFSFFIFYTVGRTPWGGDQPVAKPLPTHRRAQEKNKRTQTSTL